MPPPPDRSGDRSHRRRSTGGARDEAHGSESLLVLFAYELWHAEKSVGLWELAQRLDPWSFERVLEAVSICRTGQAAA